MPVLLAVFFWRITRSLPFAPLGGLVTLLGLVILVLHFVGIFGTGAESVTFHDQCYISRSVQSRSFSVSLDPRPLSCVVGISWEDVGAVWVNVAVERCGVGTPFQDEWGECGLSTSGDSEGQGGEREAGVRSAASCVSSVEVLEDGSGTGGPKGGFACTGSV